MNTAPVTRRVIDLDEDALRARRRRLYKIIGRGGMYPLTAPGMPVAGPDFVAHAIAQGDATVLRKKSKKRGSIAPAEVVYTPGPVLRQLYLRALREPGFTLPVLVRKGQKLRSVTFVPGHIWGQNMDAYRASKSEIDAVNLAVDGPQPADVMIIGKMPWENETTDLRCFVGPTGEKLYTAMQEARITGIEGFYITNLLKFMPPDGSSTIRAHWKADCLPLLYQELRIVRPRFILCLGADASKTLLGDKHTVSYMQGRVVPLRYPVHAAHEDEPEFHEAQVMTVVHPAQVTRDQSLERSLVQGLGRFKLLMEGMHFSEETDRDHRTFEVLEDALEYLQEAGLLLAQRVAQGQPNWVAWDAEWHGQQPINKGSYLRTVQMSVAPLTAGVFKLRDEKGKKCFVDRQGRPAQKRLMKALTEWMADKWAVGHFLVADLQWLQHHGFNLLPRFEVPLDGRDGKQAWELLMAGEGGFDTGMAAHAIEETAALGLESLTSRYTNAPRYDIPLEEWIVAYCKEQGIKRKALEGYGMVPDDTLIPYSAYDSDATLRLALALRELLFDDYHHLNCWEAFWESMIVQPVWLEMTTNGITVDRKRIERLTFMFLTAREHMEETIRRASNWPDFNIRSIQHVKEYLFGHDLNGKVTKDGRTIRLRPEGARSLHLEPLLTTGKPPKRWQDVVEKDRQGEHAPSTGKTVLSILAQEHMGSTYIDDDGQIARVGDRVNEIRGHRKLDQVLKGFLRPPEMGADGLYITDDEGEYVYDSGLAHCIDDDDRVRTHFGLAETGRWRSFRPNLHNCSKTADKDLAALVGKDEAGEPIYKEKLRSILRASWPDSVQQGFAKGTLKPADVPTFLKTVSPDECWVGIECDYIGAELYGMAIMAGDPHMIDLCQRNQLDESDPNYYDIHSSVAVLAFNLKVNDHVHKDLGKPCYEVLNLPIGAPLPASKLALMAAGVEHLRTIAKNVIFGIAYGRGAKAIALSAKEQGITISVEDAQKVIDTIFKKFPRLKPFFDQARRRALKQGWLCHCFGRPRRFSRTQDHILAGDFERQAMNFPIQGMIASALNRGVARLRQAIHQQGLAEEVRLLLTIHDAVLVECRPYLVDFLANREHGLLKWAMCTSVPIYPTDLAGRPTGQGPYFLGLDVSVFEHWSEPVSHERCDFLGIPRIYGKASRKPPTKLATSPVKS